MSSLFLTSSAKGLNEKKSKSYFGGLTKGLTSVTGALSSTFAQTNQPTLPVATQPVERDEKQAQIDSVLYLLQDLSIQSPVTHYGYVTVFASATLSPLTNDGVSYRWFKQGANNETIVLDQSGRSWYAPTIDDVDAKIFVQAEDNYNQGCSKYLEVSNQSSK